jgi:hypothetical protein
MSISLKSDWWSDRIIVKEILVAVKTLQCSLSDVAGGSNVGKVSLLANVERPDAAHRPRMTSRTFPPKANGFQPQVKNRDQKQPEHVLDRINLGRYVVERCKYELILNSIQT